MDDFVNAPIASLLVWAGIALLILSTVLQVQATIDKKNKSINATSPNRLNLAGIILGILLIAAGVGMSYRPPAGPAASPTPTVTPGLETATPQLGVTPTEPPTPTVEPDPSQTPLTGTTSIPVLTLNDGCIFASTWQAASTTQMQSANPDSSGCLSLAAAGLAADQAGVLHLLQTAKKGPLVAGIHTPVSERASVKFTVRVKNFYVAAPFAPATIFFAIAPRSDPLNSTQSARFTLLVDAVQKPLVYFMLADLNESQGGKITSQHAEFGHNYSVRLELNGVEINVFIDNVKMADQLSLPSGEKVFLIGYNLPAQAGADIEISDVRVDGVSK